MVEGGSTMEGPLWLFAVAAALIFVFLATGWTDSRSDELIRAWADQHGYEVVDHQRALLHWGPFFWTTGKGQTVYRIWIRDRQGNTREGWARCGSWWAGLMSDEVEVRWD